MQIQAKVEPHIFLRLCMKISSRCKWITPEIVRKIKKSKVFFNRYWLYTFQCCRTILQKNRELEAFIDSLRDKNEELRSCLANKKLLRKQDLHEYFNIKNEGLNSLNDYRKAAEDLEKQLTYERKKLNTNQEIDGHLNDNINILNLEVETLRNKNDKLMTDISHGVIISKI